MTFIFYIILYFYYLLYYYYYYYYYFIVTFILRNLSFYGTTRKSDYLRKSENLHLLILEKKSPDISNQRAEEPTAAVYAQLLTTGAALGGLVGEMFHEVLMACMGFPGDIIAEIDGTFCVRGDFELIDR